MRNLTRSKRKHAMESKKVYWQGSLRSVDDFDVPYDGTMYDGRTIHGPWANMTETSWQLHAFNPHRLGTGYGQKYKQQADGRWLKVEG
jgi:hypothetical protein